jgi:STE24 endopeptidase
MMTINTFLAVYLGVFLLCTAADMAIDRINAAHSKKHGPHVPPDFQGLIDADRLKQIHSYTLDKTALSLVEDGVGTILFLIVILSGLLPWWAASLKTFSFLMGGLLFFGVPAVLAALIDLPFDYYRLFVIEERYGFNTRTPALWLSDLLKSFSLAFVLGGLLLSLLLLLIQYGGTIWWVWAWGLFFSFQIAITALYPTLIAPIFNKFTPLESGSLADKIAGFAEREGLRVKGVYQMDAGKRSRHTNAYFSGLGKRKRIVLFDTLIHSHEEDEVLAVLAHETGHLKKHHIRKQVLFTGAASFVLFYMASKLIQWDLMYTGFGFDDKCLYVGLLLLALLWHPLGFLLSPLAMSLSRRFEREADRYAVVSLESATPLIKALRKMARDNLSNLRPHPLYVRFNYSHPPILERIKTLKRYPSERNPLK